MESKNNAQLRTGYLITIATGLLLLAVTYFMGNITFFLFLNRDMGVIGDVIFQYLTYFGDGVCFIIWLVLFIIYRRKLIPLLVASFAISTLLAQGLKNWVFYNVPRPIKAIGNSHSFHTVPGVTLHEMFSFPSGHTTTAFTFFLLTCIVVPKKWIVPVGYCVALAIGYSRVYLAQHFPRDLGAGMLLAVITIWLSVFIQHWTDRKGWFIKRTKAMN